MLLHVFVWNTENTKSKKSSQKRQISAKPLIYTQNNLVHVGVGGAGVSASSLPLTTNGGCWSSKLQVNQFQQYTGSSNTGLHNPGCFIIKAPWLSSPWGEPDPSPGIQNITEM